MERDDYPTLKALGFEDHELKELGLWEVATGDPATLAELYLRRSKKKDTLSSLREQLRYMCARAQGQETRIRHVWFEQKSASKAYVRREEFDKATEAIAKTGLSKTLYVFKTSRLSRRGMGQVGLLLDAFEERQARIFVCAEGIDSRNSRMVLAILSEQARDQITDLKTFVKIGLDATKAEGRYSGGVLPFGLMVKDGTQVRNPAEYPLARRIAEYLLDAKTPNWIALKLSSEGLTRRDGKPFANTGIATLAHSLRWAGLVPVKQKVTDANGRETGNYRQKGEPLRDSKGNLVSSGEGVITYAEHLKIKAQMASRSQPGTCIGDRTRGKRQVTNLGHGLLHCGRCSGTVANSGTSYRCFARHASGPAACVGVTAQRVRCDEGLTTLWINHVLNLAPDSPTIHAIARGWLKYDDPEKQDRKVNVSASLESAVDREMKLSKEYFVLGRISEDVYENLRRDLSGQIEALKAELAELTREADLTPLMDPEALAALWDGAGVDGQRALLSAALTAEGVTLMPAKGRGDRSPILGRLVPHWRDTNGRSDEEWEAATRDIG